MNNRIAKYAIPVIIALFLLGGILYFVSLFTGGKDKGEANIDEFKEGKKVFTSKKEAYDALIEDSIVNVRKENVSVNLNSLFSSKKEIPDEVLIPEEKEVIGKEATTKQFIAVKPKPISNQYPTVGNNTKQKTEVTQSPTNESETQKEATVYRESFNSVYSEEKKDNLVSGQNELSVSVVVHSKQEVYQGATVKLRSMQKVTLNGLAIPANTLIYGVASIVEERVLISIRSINYNNSIIPVTLSAYDRDGNQGIYIPGLLQHEVKKDGMDKAISEAQSALNVPHVAKIPLTVISNRNQEASAILTDNYQLTLK